MLRLHLGKLPAQFRTNRTTATGDKDDFALVVGTGAVIQQLLLLTHQQVFDVEVPQLTLAPRNLHRREIEHLGFKSGLLVPFIQFHFAYTRHSRYRKHDLLDVMAPQLFHRGLVLTHDGHAMDCATDLLRGRCR